MRRLALLVGASAIWLFLLAIPVFADGGVHVAATNSGTGTFSSGTGLSNGILTSDNCAGCHRAHTAKAYDITVADSPALCLTCHSNGTGATTDVEQGIQYAANADGTGNTGVILGALRAGGFVQARIDSSDPSRLLSPRWDSTNLAWVVSGVPKVPVAASGSPVTSKHMGISGAVLATVWGSGPISASANAGATMELNCTSCHNPHGNGMYRILNPVPTKDGSSGTFATVTNTAATVSVTDNPPYPTDGSKPVRNYTVIQTRITGIPASGLTSGNTYTGSGLFWTTDLTGYASTAGDYFRRNVPWTKDQQLIDGVYKDYRGLLGGSGTASAYNTDSPNGVFLASSATKAAPNFGTQISSWCAQCHERYHTGIVVSPGGSLSQQNTSGDATFNYRHGTVNTACTVCHVAHGSNALMPGTNSQAETLPDGTVPPQLVAGQGDSRLLKVDNRGTCQMCHEPTGTLNVFTGTSSTDVHYVGSATSDPYSGPSTIPSSP